jgi:hypothetical protein
MLERVGWVAALLLGCGSVVSLEGTGHGGGGAGAEGGGGGEPCDETTPPERCWEGPADRDGVGECRAGVRTCEDGGLVCAGQVLPIAEACDTAADESCDGDGSCTGGSLESFGDATGEQAGGADVAALGWDAAVVVGFFSQTLELGGATLSSDAERDAFVARIEDGKAIWAVTAHGEADARAVAVTPAGDIVVAGSFRGSIDFGLGPLSSHGASDIFVASFTADGAPLWNQSFGGSRVDWATDVSIDENGIVLAGGFEQSTAIGGTALDGAGETDGLLVRLDAGGVPLFAHALGAAGFDHALGASVEPGGGALVTGSFDGTMKLGDQTIASHGSEDAYVASFDSTGTLRWLRQLEGAGHELGKGVAVGPSGQVVLTGLFDSVLFAGDVVLVDAGDYDTFWLELDAAGTPVRGLAFGGGNAGVDPERIAVDSAGNTVIGFMLSGGALFGDIVLAAAGDPDGYAEDVGVVKIDPEGRVVWARSFGDENRQRLWGMGVGLAGDVWLTGDYQGTVDFGQGSLPPTAGNTWGMFLAHLQH